MIALPIARWLWGDDALVWCVTLSVLLQTGAVLTILTETWSRKKLLQWIILIITAAWLIEWVGSHTGLPFGHYHYTSRLWPQLGNVPLLIPLAWLMMLPPAWAIAHRIVGPNAPRWQFFLDPQMVAWNFWVWDQPGGYFGIPWLNYFGWWIASAFLTAISHNSQFTINNSPLTIHHPLFIIYIITWLLETGGLLFFWGLIGPGIVGFVAMGVLIGAALWKRSTSV